MNKKPLVRYENPLGKLSQGELIADKNGFNRKQKKRAFCM
jgi:hypothetical protein